MSKAHVKFVLSELIATDGFTSSFDLEADTRFADAFDLPFGGGYDVMRIALAPVRIFVGRRVDDAVRVRRLRLAALRALVRQGLVKASWRGLGSCGVTDFGVNRVRVYRLVQMPGVVTKP